MFLLFLGIALAVTARAHTAPFSFVLDALHRALIPELRKMDIQFGTICR